MGTRSITILMDGDTELAVLYRQYDGQPEGQGADISACFRGKRPTAGYLDPKRDVNGAGDMAVQLIAYVKTETCRDWETGDHGPVNVGGNFYLKPAGTRDVDEEFTYTLTFPDLDNCEPADRVLQLKIVSSDYDGGNQKTVYSGPLDGFDPDGEKRRYRFPKQRSKPAAKKTRVKHVRLSPTTLLVTRS